MNTRHLLTNWPYGPSGVLAVGHRFRRSCVIAASISHGAMEIW